MAEVIQKIQFKRGLKVNLENLLVGDNKPTVAEPIYELDTGKLKLGDGIHDYKDLPYLSGDASDIVVQDPLDGQTLLYDATSGK